MAADVGPVPVDPIVGGCTTPLMLSKRRIMSTNAATVLGWGPGSSRPRRAQSACCHGRGRERFRLQLSEEGIDGKDEIFQMRTVHQIRLGPVFYSLPSDTSQPARFEVRKWLSDVQSSLTRY